MIFDTASFLNMIKGISPYYNGYFCKSPWKIGQNPEAHTSYACKYRKAFPYQVLFTFLLTVLAYICWALNFRLLMMINYSNNVTKLKPNIQYSRHKLHFIFDSILIFHILLINITSLIF